MCLTATAVKDAIEIVEVQGNLGGGLEIIVVDIDPANPYGSFKRLPAAIEYNGRVFGKSGYNSDTNRAYYRTDKPVARVIRRG